MITKEQALTCDNFHYVGRHKCVRTVGPKGGITEKITQARRSGVTKTWKRDTTRFHVPVKYGMYESWYIDQDNCGDFHTADECPLLKG